MDSSLEERTDRLAAWESPLAWIEAIAIPSVHPLGGSPPPLKFIVSKHTFGTTRLKRGSELQSGRYEAGGTEERNRARSVVTVARESKRPKKES